MQYMFTLDNVYIADAIESLRTALSAQGLPSKEVTRHTLVTEEVLLNWQQHLGMEASCHLTLCRRFSRFHLRLRCAGVAVNPLPSDDEDRETDFANAFGYSLLLRLSTKAHYSYTNGFNEISLTITKPSKKSPTQTLLAHMAAGIAMGFLLHFFPWAPALTVNKEIIVPLLKLFSNFLCGVLTFVVFFSICTSIIELTSLQKFYSVAGKSVGRFLFLNVLGAALTGLACVFMLPLPLSSSEYGGNVFGSVRDMLLALVPPNLTSPFATGNIPQVVILAFMCGGVMLLLETQVKPLKEQLQSINLLLLSCLDILAKCIPLFIVGTIIQCFFVQVTSVLNTALHALALGLVGIPLLSMACFWIAAWRAGRPPLTAFRQGFPAVVVALCTMSSAASFPVLLKTCKENLRLPEKLCNFGVPVALVLNKLPSAASFTLVTAACSIVFGVDLSLESLLLLIVQSSVLCIAAPPVAGGTLLVYAVLFRQYNMPEEALGLAAVLALILDPMVTAMRAMVAQAVLMDVAGPEKQHHAL